MHPQEWLKLKAVIKSQAKEVVIDETVNNPDETQENTLIVSGERGQTKFLYRSRLSIAEHPQGLFSAKDRDYAFNAEAMANWLRIWRRPADSNSDSDWQEINLEDLKH